MKPIEQISVPIYRVRNLLMRSSLICSFAQIAQDKWANVRDSLRSLRTNEWMWAIRSGRLGQMGKWANRSVFLSKSLIFSFAHKKWAIHSRKSYFCSFSSFFAVFFKKSIRFAHSFWAKWANCSGHSGQMSDRERFAQVAQKAWAIVSKLLRSLTKNKQMIESLIRSLFVKKLAIRSEI